MNFIVIITNNILNIFKRTANRINIVPEFARNTVFQRWGIGICLSFILSLLLTPHIHFIHPHYKVGSIVSKDIKADRDFLVEDRVSTDQKRMETLKGTMSLYDYDSDTASQLTANLNNAFSLIGKAYHGKDKLIDVTSQVGGQELSRQTRKDFEKALGITLTDDEFNILRKYMFSPEVASKTSKLITAVYDTGLITDATFPRYDIDRGIIIRDVRTQNEISVLLEEVPFLHIRKEKGGEGLLETWEGRGPAKIWHLEDVETILRKRAKTILGRDQEEIKKVAVSLAKRLIQPNLTFNRDATEKRKQITMAGVKPVYFQVQKNEMIVREGEKISRTDLDKLEAFYKIEGERRLSSLSIFLGIFLTIIFLTIIFFHLARNWLKKIKVDILFLSATALLQVLLVRAGIFISEAINRAFPFLPTEACFFVIPFAVGAMLVGIFMNRNIAFIFSVFLSFLITFLFDGKMTMFLFSFFGSVAVSYHVVAYRQRSAFFRTGLFLGAINGMTIVFLSLLSGSIASMDTIIKLFMGIPGGIVAGIIVAGITPLFEALFPYTTDIKLLELANLNRPVFQRMIMEAPGTYHHSIIVASMVEAAADAIGANSLMAKVSAFYHDIGKMKKPQYFIENQQSGENKHDKLSPKMSSLVIISHVKDGCELANKIKLGPEIINIIKQHHGTSLVNYFYDKAKKDRDPSIRSLSESDFQYPGPKPQTKEAGLVLLGDVVEASSRTLSNPAPSRINHLVRERIERIFMDGQLDECELTLRDLNKIAETFARILNGIFHHRIDYPDSIIRDNGSRKLNNGNIDRKSAEKNKDRPPAGAAGTK
ncbi:MAG: HDIG domain-containing protein [Syntrophales bacterium]|nr:HDIG domain-containing protein [Syntrophales bacterium]